MMHIDSEAIEVFAGEARAAFAEYRQQRKTWLFVLLYIFGSCLFPLILVRHLSYLRGLQHRLVERLAVAARHAQESKRVPLGTMWVILRKYEPHTIALRTMRRLSPHCTEMDLAREASENAPKAPEYTGRPLVVGKEWRADGPALTDEAIRAEAMADKGSMKKPHKCTIDEKAVGFAGKQGAVMKVVIKKSYVDRLAEMKLQVSSISGESTEFVFQSTLASIAAHAAGIPLHQIRECIASHRFRYEEVSQAADVFPSVTESSWRDVPCYCVTLE